MLGLNNLGVQEQGMKNKNKGKLTKYDNFQAISLFMYILFMLVIVHLREIIHNLVKI